MLSSWHHGQKRGNCFSCVMPGMTFVFVFLPHNGQIMKPLSVICIASSLVVFGWADPLYPGQPDIAAVHYSAAGAADRNRTCNLMITNHLLCQLSYEGKCFLSVFSFSDQGFQTTPPTFPGTPSPSKLPASEPKGGCLKSVLLIVIIYIYNLTLLVLDYYISYIIFLSLRLIYIQH